MDKDKEWTIIWEEEWCWCCDDAYALYVRSDGKPDENGNLFLFEMHYWGHSEPELYFVPELVKLLEGDYYTKAGFLVHCDGFPIYTRDERYLHRLSDEELRENTLLYQSEIMTELFGCECPKCKSAIPKLPPGCWRTMYCSKCSIIFHYAVSGGKLVVVEGFHQDCVDSYCECEDKFTALNV